MAEPEEEVPSHLTLVDGPTVDAPSLRGRPPLVMLAVALPLVVAVGAYLLTDGLLLHSHLTQEAAATFGIILGVSLGVLSAIVSCTFMRARLWRIQANAEGSCMARSRVFDELLVLGAEETGAYYVIHVAIGHDRVERFSVPAAMVTREAAGRDSVLFSECRPVRPKTTGGRLGFAFGGDVTLLYVEGAGLPPLRPDYWPVRQAVR